MKKELVRGVARDVIYNFAYSKLKDKGPFRHLLFRIWYEIEWQRVELLNRFHHNQS